MKQKLDVPIVIERVFEVYRDQFTLLVPAALILFVPLAVLKGLVATTGSIPAAVASIAVGVIGTFWFQGMVVEAAKDILDGRRDHTIGSLFGSAAPVILPLLGAGVVCGVAIVAGIVLLVVPGLILITIWAVVAPAIVVERKGVFEALGRSRQLVKGSGWQVFGVIVAFFLLQVVLAEILNTISRSIGDVFLSHALGDLVVRTLVAPLAGLAAAMMYFELRRLKGEPLPGAQPARPAA